MVKISTYGDYSSLGAGLAHCGVHNVIVRVMGGKTGSTSLKHD